VFVRFVSLCFSFQNIEKKKLKPDLHGYDVYKEDDEFEDKPSVLSKYDAEIQGEKTSSFALGEEMSEAARRQNLQAVRQKLQGKTLISLDLPAPQLASEYYTEEEMSVKFKKPKKKVCVIWSYFMVISYAVSPLVWSKSSVFWNDEGADSL
jgi:U4/U6.U5 tri-snRNP-associated protein 1